MKRLARRAALLAALAAAAPPCFGQEAGLRVGTIRIESLDVFSDEEAAQGWVYRAANALHITTRVSVIRNFLLFKEGDPYDPNRLTETERNLRNLPFIKSASVLAHPPQTASWTWTCARRTRGRPSRGSPSARRGE